MLRTALAAPLLMLLPGLAAAQAIQVCPAAVDPASFQNESLGPIAQGDGDWLFRTPSDMIQEFALDGETAAYLSRLVQALAGQGVTLVLAMPPTRGIVHYDEIPEDSEALEDFDVEAAIRSFARYSDELRKTGMVVPNVLAHALSTAMTEPFFFPRDHHWTTQGARLTAFAIATELRKLPGFAELEAAEYASAASPDETFQLYEAFAGSVEDVCGVNYPNKFVTVWRTTPAGAAITAAALLDDVSYPPVVIVGTSNANKNNDDGFNFGGFLSEYSGLDVLNAGTDGGGFDSSLLAYLRSDDYVEHRPTVLVWEVPAYYAFDKPEIYREAIPAVYGACAESEAVTSGQFEIAGEELSLLPRGINDFVRGHDYYLYFEASDLALVDFDVVVRHLGGARDKFPFKRSTREANNGRFFLEFRDDRTAPVEDITLELPAGASGTVTARICQVPA